MSALGSLRLLAAMGIGLSFLCGLRAVPVSGGGVHTIENSLVRCVAMEEISSNPAAVRLRLSWHKPIGYCGCTSAMAVVHWQHGNQLLGERYFSLRESQVLRFALPDSAPVGMRLYLGCG